MKRNAVEQNYIKKHGNYLFEKPTRLTWLSDKLPNFSVRLASTRAWRDR